MPLRQNILDTLHHYGRTWASHSIAGKEMAGPPLERVFDDEESMIVARFLDFIAQTPDCFLRATLPGHFTGSALVVNKSMSAVLLTHHKKLGLWLQLGGHADGHHLLHEVAMAEAYEESGLTNLSFLNYEQVGIHGHPSDASPNGPLPFDIDGHSIPASHKDPSHLHFDVRYVVIAESESMPIVSDESHDVRWFSLAEARALTNSRSMHRQFDKIEWLREALNLPL